MPKELEFVHDGEDQMRIVCCRDSSSRCFLRMSLHTKPHGRYQVIVSNGSGDPHREVIDSGDFNSTRYGGIDLWIYEKLGFPEEAIVALCQGAAKIEVAKAK